MPKKISDYSFIIILVFITFILFISETVHAQAISIELQDASSAAYTTWVITPKVPLNTEKTMLSAEGVKVVIDAKEKINLSASASSTGPWKAGISPGLNIYKLEVKSFDSQQGTPVISGADTKTILDTTDIFDSKIKAKTTIRWVYAKVTTPTATTTGRPQLITVTITATAN